MGWGSFASEGVTVRICPGDHESILEEENVETTARELEIVLTKTAALRLMLEHRQADLPGTNSLGQFPV